MERITFSTSSGADAIPVDHAVKGTDYVHGYDAKGNLVVSFEGLKDFSCISYSGTYLKPSDCLEETCNTVRHTSGRLKRLDGTKLYPSDIGVLSGTSEPDDSIGEDGDIYLQILS